MNCLPHLSFSRIAATPRNWPSRCWRSLLLAACVPLAACGGSADQATRATTPAYPDDATLSRALEIDWNSDPAGAEAQALLHTLGGPDARVHYDIHSVIAQPVGFLVHYDARVQLQQDGAQSLQQFAQRLSQALRTETAPQADANTDADAAATDGDAMAQLRHTIDALREAEPQQAAALDQLLQRMQQCYQHRRKGDDVPLITQLQAQLWPERNQGWYAERIPGARTQVACLPL